MKYKVQVWFFSGRYFETDYAYDLDWWRTTLLVQAWGSVARYRFTLLEVKA